MSQELANALQRLGTTESQLKIYRDECDLYIARSPEHASELQGKQIGNGSDSSPPSKWIEYTSASGSLSIAEYGPLGETVTKTIGEWIGEQGEGFLCSTEY